MVRVNRGLFGWGVFFIVAGLVPLAVRNGAVPASALDGVFGLWPLILVGVGLGLLLADTRAAILGGLVVAVTCGLIAGSLLAGATGFGAITGACGIGGTSDAGTPFPSQSGSFAGPAEVRLDVRCGSVEAVTTTGAGWSLSGTAGPGLEPEVEADGTGLRVSAHDSGGVVVGGEAARWMLELPDAVPLALRLDVDAGAGDLALDRAQVTSLAVHVNAGDGRVGLWEAEALRSLEASVNAGALTLDLPAAPFRGRISVNAGSAEVCLPAGTALRVSAGNVSLGSTNLGSRGLVEQGSTWTTTGFSEAAVQVELDVSVNVGSFVLNPETGCG